MPSVVALEWEYPKDKSERFEIDSICQAVRALYLLGFCMNQAILTKLTENAAFLFYEGWVYRDTYERHVKLPFSEYDPDFRKKFIQLLNKIFGQFTEESDEAPFKSMSAVLLKREGGAWLMRFSYILRGNDPYGQAHAALDEVDDSHQQMEATYFSLD